MQFGQALCLAGGPLRAQEGAEEATGDDGAGEGLQPQQQAVCHLQTLLLVSASALQIRIPSMNTLLATSDAMPLLEQWYAVAS